MSKFESMWSISVLWFFISEPWVKQTLFKHIYEKDIQVTIIKNILDKYNLKADEKHRITMA